MSRSIYDIDPAGNVLTTYTGTDSEKETLRSVSLAPSYRIPHSPPLTRSRPQSQSQSQSQSQFQS